MVAAVPDRRWRLYVGNIKANTSEREIEDYCADQNVRVMKVEVISQQDPDDPAKPVAMCVEFDYADKDKVMVEFLASRYACQGLVFEKEEVLVYVLILALSFIV